jgi:hypothetical protein
MVKENAEFPELNNMCPSGNGNDDEEENSPFDGYMKGNIACVADGCTTVTFGALIGSFRREHAKADTTLSDDEDDTEICVDETDDASSEVTSATELKGIIATEQE